MKSKMKRLNYCPEPEVGDEDPPLEPIPPRK